MKRNQSLSALMLILTFVGILNIHLTPSIAKLETTPIHKAVSMETLGHALQTLVTMPEGPPGAVAVVQQGEKLMVITRGVSNLISGRKILAQDHMRIASTAKAFSGAAALSLVDLGILSLDDRISTLLPDLPDAWGEVTLREALNHTSGLPDFTKNNDFVAAFISDPHKVVSPRQLLSYIKNEDLRFPPGSKYEYSNTDNIVVGLMCEAASKMSYEQVLQIYVFDRLGLKKTSLPKGFLMPSSYIRGYEFIPNEPIEDVSTIASGAWSWASGGIVSTPHDMNQFIRGYVGGRLFNQDVQRQQFQFIPGGKSDPPGPGQNSAGLALFQYKTRCGTVFGHTGNIFGYTQFIAATPDSSASVVVSINRQLTPEMNLTVFQALENAEEIAVCQALGQN